MSEPHTDMDPRGKVLAALRTKACMKQDVYERVKALFLELKDVLKEIATDLQEQTGITDARLAVSYTERSETACELRVAGDLVIFNAHTNVFRLDRSHALWKTGYLEEDEMRGYFGVVNVYNFLNDSMLYNRERDMGYLVARLLVNKDDHFFVQGKRELGFLFNDLGGMRMDRDHLREILFAIIDHVIEFDLLAPPFEQMQQVTVSEVKEMYLNQQLTTGKRMGFRSQADMEDVS